ncbi:phosphonate ABC transporter ATP-binding protein [Metamycoplasma neophronis]|uniref:ATP-binding cassette domain-containing protein n=1 Tax=Metamycoplasma neophronis TaxID=872983 RepID=A0ABY2Z5A2_9BACT|nr:ATP-binding cassette domain-containing protein [Metamycoplasma neophronis]TPR54683.1 ATP-binding cassette domain-containing protein [Metamycoplasma neophronis]
MTKIEFKNYTASYKKNNDIVLDNLNLTIAKGEMVAIIGKSGAGKSTIFNALLNQLNIVAGELIFNDKSVLSMKKNEWKKQLRKIGFLSQMPNLIDDLNVYDNILHFYTKYKNFLYSWLHILTKKQKEEIYKTLERLGIFDKSFTLVSELSGGQKQRIEIAKLLLQNVSLILADEPTSNLDIVNSEEVMSILKNINENMHVTVLVNIHDLTLVKKFFKKFVYIKNGKIEKSGSTSNLTEYELKQIYQND